MEEPQKNNAVDSLSLRIFYPLVWLTCFLLIELLGPLTFRVFKRGRVPKKGGLLIMANHISDIDVVAIQLACPRRVYFMAKEELFDIPFIGWFIGWLGAFPVKRGAPDRKAIKKAVELLKKGCAVALFPEGGLSQTGELQPLLPGAALIAQLGEVPVICCGVKNTNRILPYGKLIPRPAFSWITVRWGKMESFDKNASREEIIEWAESQLRDLTV